jgi:hypothetical protein
MFEMRKFVKDGLLDAVGKMADYWVILNATVYHEKGTLTEEDLAEIQALIDAKNAKPDEMALMDDFNGLKGAV